MGEPNQVKWRGIRPVDPREAIPVQPFGDFGTQIVKDTYADNSTVIIHTVTSGKSLYLCSIALSVIPAATGYGYFYVRDDSDTTQYRFFRPRRQQYDGEMVSMTFNPPLIIPEGWDICLMSQVDGFGMRGFIFGYEV